MSDAPPSLVDAAVAQALQSGERVSGDVAERALRSSGWPTGGRRLLC